jgi:hypothetical protein
MAGGYRHAKTAAIAMKRLAAIPFLYFGELEV